MNPCKTGIPNAQWETIALVVLEIASFSICIMESTVTFIVRHAGNRTTIAILASRASILYILSLEGNVSFRLVRQARLKSDTDLPVYESSATSERRGGRYRGAPLMLLCSNHSGTLANSSWNECESTLCRILLGSRFAYSVCRFAVSYTHLTLTTIYSV